MSGIPTVKKRSNCKGERVPYGASEEKDSTVINFTTALYLVLTASDRITSRHFQETGKQKNV